MNPSRRLKLVAGLAAALAGCSGPARPSGTRDVPTADAPAPQQFAGVAFVAPPGWSSERLEGGLLLLAPEIEAGWQANLFLELREDEEARSLEEGMADLVPNLEARKQHFQEISRRIERQPGGLRFGRIKYTCANQGTALTEWEVIIPLEGRKRLFVLASSASARWSRYQPAFQQFIESLRTGSAGPDAAAGGGRSRLLRR